MLIARAKRKENIIEYILYMYQLEDIIRSLNFDMNLITAKVVDKFDQPEEVKMAIRSWYEEMVNEMKSSSLERSGHLKHLKELTQQLQDLHKRLLTTYQDDKYQKLYQSARPELITLVERSGGMKLNNEIDVALNGMYGLLILKLKGEKISEQTSSAMQKVSSFLAYLALQFKKMEEGDLSLSNVNEN